MALITVDRDTTYSDMSSSELTTGTATTSRTVRADYLKTGVDSLIDTKINALDVTGASGIAASKTISGWSETNGKVSLTTQNISITKSQVSDFPTIPTVNNATLTIQKNGTSVGTFTANASTNKTVNITVPDIATGYFTSGNVTLAANSPTDVTITGLTKSGYTPLIAFYASNTMAGSIYASTATAYVSEGGSATFTLYNPTSSSKTGKVNCRVLFQKTIT